MRKILVLILIAHICKGQNLVQNNSFELSEAKISTIDNSAFRVSNEKEFAKRARGFYSVSASSPDIIDSKNKKMQWSDFGDTILTDFRAKTGDIAVGLRLSGCDKVPLFCKEFLIAPLTEPLTIGEKYVISFWYSRMKGSVIVPLHVYLSDTMLDKNPVLYKLGIKPQINIKIDSQNKPFEWVEFRDTIVAARNTRFVVIGNFSNDSDIQAIKPQNEQIFTKSYYFIDDIFVGNIHQKVVEKPLKSTIDTLTLEDIDFDFNSSQLNPNELKKLAFVDAYLSQHKVQKIDIVGHTDNIGTLDFNQKLSEARAKSIYEYLSKKYPLLQISYKGEGANMPKYDNNTPNRKKNRRVEILITKSDN